MARDPQQLYRENLIQRFNDPDLQDFVTSTLNILSDGIDVDDIHGLKIESKSKSQKLISFFDKINQKSPIWSLSMNEDNRSKGLNISEGGESRLFIRKGGNIGIGTMNPLFKLNVEGVISNHGRVGTYAYGNIPADGKWHSILTNMTGCQGFEAMAHVNFENDQRYALTHGILLMSNKKGSKNQVKTVEASSNWIWGRFLNKIKFRWKVDDENSTPEVTKFKLQIRSRSRFGMPSGTIPNIFYRLSKIWDMQFENEERQYQSSAPRISDERPSLRQTRAAAASQSRPASKLKIKGR